MSATVPVVDYRLHRLEVHADRNRDDAAELAWNVTCAPDDEAVFVFGYLMNRAEMGFGQVATVAVVGKSRGVDIPEDPAELEAWVRRYVLEALYDLGRRALQSQAAAMDFQLDLPSGAPEVAFAFDLSEE